MVNFFTSSFTLLTKHRKIQYTFSLLLPNYQPNTGKDTHKFSFSKENKPTFHFLTSAHFLESNSLYEDLFDYSYHLHVLTIMVSLMKLCLHFYNFWNPSYIYSYYNRFITASSSNPLQLLIFCFWII